MAVEEISSEEEEDGDEEMKEGDDVLAEVVARGTAAEGAGEEAEEEEAEEEEEEDACLTQASSTQPALLPLVASQQPSSQLSQASLVEFARPASGEPFGQLVAQEAAPLSPSPPLGPAALVDARHCGRAPAGQLVAREVRRGPAESAAAARASASRASLAAAEAAHAGGAPAAEARSRARLIGPKVDVTMADFKLDIPVDAPALARAIPNAELGGRADDLVVIRSFRKPAWAAVVSRTGLARVYTQTHGEVARTAAKRLARLVRKRYSASAAFKAYRVRNVHVAARLGFRVNTEGLGRNLPAGFRLVSLAPGSTAVEVEMDERKVNVHVYRVGRMKVCDAKFFEEAVAAMEAVLPLAQQHGTWW